jgi:hypothetical protein
MSTIRTRTPPTVKWLANELAAMAGELERIDEELVRLQARRAHIVAVRAAMGGVADLLVVPQLAGAVPAVRAHTTFGDRGSLRNVVRACLREAHPAPVDIRAVTAVVVEHFELTFASLKERQRFQHHSVGRTLHRLFERGEVERVSDPRVTRHLPSIWRWKVEGGTLDELAQRAAAIRVAASTATES